MNFSYFVVVHKNNNHRNHYTHIYVLFYGDHEQ